MIGCPLLLAGVILLTGCSKDSGEEPVPEQKQVITFSGRLQEETTVTRAGLEEKLDNKTFQVWGYKNTSYDATQGYTSYQAVMPDFTVNWIANTAYTTTTNTNDWEYVGQGPDQTIKYWDMSASAYRFFGYAIGNATASPAVSASTVTETDRTSNSPATYVFSSTVDANSEATRNAAPYFTRLWFSTGALPQYQDKQFGQPVQLQFVKPLCRVRFMFTIAEGVAATRPDIKEISFHPTTYGATIATAGTVAVTYPITGTATQESWSISNIDTSKSLDKFEIDYYEEPTPAVNPANSLPTTWPNSPQQWYYVLPAPTQGSFKLEAQVVTREVKTAEVPAEYMRWQAGYQYTYKFKVTESGGITLDIIQVGIDDWVIKNASEHTVYNW